MRSLRSTMITLVIAASLLSAANAMDRAPQENVSLTQEPPGFVADLQLLASPDVQLGGAACEASPAAASRAITISDIVFNSQQRRASRLTPTSLRAMRNSDFVLKKTVSDRSTTQREYS